MPLVPITDRFFKANDYVALRFLEGNVFVRIDAAEILEYSPYNVAAEDNVAITLDEQEGSSEITPKDPRAAAREILGGEHFGATPMGYGEGMGQFLHGAVGIFPNHIRIYIRAPAKGSGRLVGEFPGLAAPNPVGGESLAKMDGHDSPYSQPTNFRELVIVPGMSWSATYFNNEPTALTGQAYDEEQPILKLLFCRYACEILRPALDPRNTSFGEGPEGKFAEEKARRDNRLIRGLVTGRIPNSPNIRFEYLTVGTGFAPQPFGGPLRDWKVLPIPDKAALLLEEF